MSFTLHVYMFLSRLYNKMTMEVILSTAFGRALDVQGGKGGKLFESAVAVFSALAPPKKNEPSYIFRILQLTLCKFFSWFILALI